MYTFTHMCRANSIGNFDLPDCIHAIQLPHNVADPYTAGGCHLRANFFLLSFNADIYGVQTNWILETHTTALRTLNVKEDE